LQVAGLEMAETARLICAARDLADRGKGVRFEIELDGALVPAFAVRFDGEVRAYVNRCPHMQTELDWLAGEFFDESGLYLICATHGATFLPGTGYCCAGPCRGATLDRIPVHERDGNVYCFI
jgi:nitrite reductase/ring-hydroxylating ferredoxin subunit